MPLSHLPCMHPNKQQSQLLFIACMVLSPCVSGNLSTIHRRLISLRNNPYSVHILEPVKEPSPWPRFNCTKCSVLSVRDPLCTLAHRHSAQVGPSSTYHHGPPERSSPAPAKPAKKPAILLRIITGPLVSPGSFVRLFLFSHHPSSLQPFASSPVLIPSPPPFGPCRPDCARSRGSHVRPWQAQGGLALVADVFVAGQEDDGPGQPHEQ